MGLGEAAEVSGAGPARPRAAPGEGSQGFWRLVAQQVQDLTGVGCGRIV